MKKIRFLSLLASIMFFHILCGGISALAQEIFFVKQKSELWKTDSDGSYTEKVANVQGFFHRISPDGKWLAMTKISEYSRIITLLHLETKRIRILPIPAKHSFRPMWSSDSQKIAFNFKGEEGGWKVGVIDVNGKNFDVVSRGSGQKVWTFLGCWTDSDTIFYYDHTSIYEVDMQKNIINAIPWDTLGGSEPVLNGGTMFSISDDNRYLLYNTMIENEYIRGIIGPIDAIFVYDMKQGTSKRVSPIGVFASEPHWIPGGSQFIYTGTTEEDIQGIQNIKTRIYIDSLERLQPTLLVDEGEYLSVSMPK